MEKIENGKELLRDIYNQARVQGLCHTQKEFATLLGFNPANISSFLSGYAPITEQTMARIKEAATATGISLDQHGTANTQVFFVGGDILGGYAQKTQNNPAWCDIVAEKDKQINRLLSIIEKMQSK